MRPSDQHKHRKEFPNLTLSLLHSMSDMPLYRAAEQLGMSTSFLKAACRRVGIARWPRAGRSIGGVAKLNPVQVNINYSRQLYRRYASNSNSVVPSPRSIKSVPTSSANLSSDKQEETILNNLVQAPQTNQSNCNAPLPLSDPWDIEWGTEHIAEGNVLDGVADPGSSWPHPEENSDLADEPGNPESWPAGDDAGTGGERDGTAAAAGFLFERYLDG